MRISKAIQAQENTWVMISEFPDRTLRIEGITEHPTEFKTYQIANIRFSLEAVKALIPLLTEWAESMKK